jgi:MEMO1 family protein
MPIVFSAITPHPPIAIPTIGKDNVKQIEATTKAFLKLEQELYASQPDSIIVISPHGYLQEDAFTINLSPEFTAGFDHFGDLTTKFTLAGDIGLAHQIKESLETKVQLQLTSEPELDHGSSVPLYFLTQHLPKIKIIPLYYSGLDLKAHYDFGQMIKSKLTNSPNRIAIVASGDLSQRLIKNAPAGYSPKGKKFDQKLIDCLLKKETEELIKLKPEFIEEAGECGLKSIMILLGILEGVKYEPQLLSYEYPFGVGYLVMNLEL